MSTLRFFASADNLAAVSTYRHTQQYFQLLASNAMSMLLVNPNGFSSIWGSMSLDSKRELAAAVLCLAGAQDT